MTEKEFEHMNTLVTRRSPALAGLMAALTSGMFVSACSDKPEPAEEGLPDVAEVEVEEPGRVRAGEGEVEIELPDIKFEDAFPLSDEDDGDLVVAVGTVVGTPRPSGFFLQTPSNKVLFVESTTIPVQARDRVSVVGPLRKATVEIFGGWKKEALGGELSAEWEPVDLWFVEATSITKL